MKLIEISPYVRFAYRICFKSNRPTVAKDHRLFYVTDGEGVIEINGEPYSFSPGTVMLLQAGTVYSILTPARTMAISINFDFTTEHSDVTEPYPVLSPENAPKIEPVVFDDCPALNFPIVCTASSQILEVIEKLLFESTSQQPFFTERISALMKDVIISVARASAMPVYSRSDSALAQVLDYIHLNYADSIDNMHLAELVGYHPYYLNKLFLNAKGITMHKYVINYRISVAEQLLLSTSLSVDDVAQRVGFSSALSFSVSFKKKTGLSPTEFKKKYGAII